MCVDQEPLFHSACPMRSPWQQSPLPARDGHENLTHLGPSQCLRPGGTLIITEQPHGPTGFPLVPCQGEGQTGCPGRRGKSSSGVSPSPSPSSGGPL